MVVLAVLADMQFGMFTQNFIDQGVAKQLRDVYATQIIQICKLGNSHMLEIYLTWFPYNKAFLIRFLSKLTLHQ